MISPPPTRWPANTLTPSIFGFESRPLRLEPSPFLCAISCPLLSCDGGLLFGRFVLCLYLLPANCGLLLLRPPPGQHLSALVLALRQLPAVARPAAGA